jgi:hypothetical protein
MAEDQRHIDRAAELARQQAVIDAVAALDLSQVGRSEQPPAESPIPEEAPKVIKRRVRRQRS